MISVFQKLNEVISLRAILLGYLQTHKYILSIYIYNKGFITINTIKFLMFVSR